MLFGGVENGVVLLSPSGVIAERYLRLIPEHHPGVSMGPCVVMPDHVHLILHLAQLQDEHTHQTTRPPADPEVTTAHGICPPTGSLSVIVRSYKAAVTRTLRNDIPGTPHEVWQRSFFDRVIRNDRERFFIEQYVRLNPVLWDLEQQHALNPRHTRSLAHTLRTRYGLEDATAQYLADQVIAGNPLMTDSE
jgi:REP element-mobilizing transposase RayT